MQFLIRIDESIRQTCPDCRLGFLTIRGMSVVGSSPVLSQEFMKLQAEVSKIYNIESVSKLPKILSVRNMYRKLEFDPSRYRPASEALVRRVLQNKGVYFVNSAVDVNNYCSLKFLLPFGLYDAGKIEGDVSYFRADSGSYVNIGGHEVSAVGKPFLADDKGIFGNPTSDSRRTAVSLTTTDVLAVVFADAESSEQELVDILHFAGEMQVRYNGGTLEQATVVGCC
jgi:DNA/RNA-binding domain of Phe-tRNA-synthetase-like protein